MTTPPSRAAAGDLYHPLSLVSSPVILLHSFFFPSFSFFLLLFLKLSTGRLSAATSLRSWGGGAPWVAPSPSPLYSSCCLISPYFSETKLHVKFVVVNIISTNNCYNSTGTVCSLCPRYSTSGPDRSKNSSTILGRLISSGFFVSMNMDRGVGHAQ